MTDALSALSLHIGRRIRLYRRAKHMSMEDLGAGIHKTKATVSKYEQGLITIDIETLYLIAKVLNVSVLQLLDYAEDPGRREATGEAAGPEYFYMYNYSGKRMVHSVIRVSGIHNDRSGQALFFYDVAAFDTPEQCQHIYWGRINFSDLILSFVLQNQGNHIEDVMITAFNPIKRGKVSKGIMLGLSEVPVMPSATKILLNKDMPLKDEALMDQLLISKEEMKQLKCRNTLSIL